MTVDELLTRLHGIRKTARGFMARCPAHADHSPSLSIRAGTDRILIHCFGSCKPSEIVGALGLTLADLFFDLCTPHGHRPIPKLKKLDLVALAFQFEMGALDRRLRADRILKAAKGFTIEGMQDEEFERLTKAVVRAYSDQERAEFLEMVADDLRVKAYQTRIALNAA